MPLVANLTAGAVLKLRDRDGWVPAALALVYPALHARIPSPSPSLAAKLAELPPLFQPPAGGDHTLSESYLRASGEAFTAAAALAGVDVRQVTIAETVTRGGLSGRDW